MASDYIENIARGIKEILEKLAGIMPASKFLLLGVLPRSGSLSNKAKKLNLVLKQMADEKIVFWLDMWSTFESPEGEQHKELYMPDLVHLSRAGYDAWQKTMEPILTKLDDSFKNNDC